MSSHHHHTKITNEHQVKKASLATEVCFTVNTNTNEVSYTQTNHTPPLRSTSRHKPRRKEGISSLMPQVYSELTKFIANHTKRKISSREKSSHTSSPLITVRGTSSNNVATDLNNNNNENWRSSEENKVSFLSHAVRDSDLNSITKLVGSGHANVNERNKHGITVLHEAALIGNLQCVQLLVEKGATVDAVDADSCTCLDYAVYGGNFDCASFLIKSGAKTESIRNGFHKK